MRDKVFVKNLALRAVAGKDAWKRLQAVPLFVSFSIEADLIGSFRKDVLSRDLNYDLISRNLMRQVESQSTFKSLFDLTETIKSNISKNAPQNANITVSVTSANSLLRATCKVHLVSESSARVFLTEMPLSTIIGVNEVERQYKQNVLLNVSFDFNPLNPPDLQTISDSVTKQVQESSYYTIESLVDAIGLSLCSKNVFNVNVSLRKPSALSFAQSAGVQVFRNKKDYENLPEAPKVVQETQNIHKTYIAFGSNQGAPVKNIKGAIQCLKDRGIQVDKTSSLYISKPMYHTDQDDFYNGVLACQTSLSPQELLKALKDIEYNELGRKKLHNNGPRSIDLDILLYDSEIVDEANLTIPHRDMLNRSFVMQPLVDVATLNETHPITTEVFSHHLAQIPPSSESQTSSQLLQAIPLASISGPEYLHVDPVTHKLHTIISAVVNLTPDSFSDGGRTESVGVVKTALDHVNAGAHMLDLGGVSTRPGANLESVSIDQELERVIPAIEAIRSTAALAKVPISIDTFRAQVAKEALKAGANLINDVFGGVSDPEMFAVAQEFEAPIIIGHMTTNHNHNQDIIELVGHELEQRVQAALSAGLERWQLILDSGLGFGKQPHDDVSLIRGFNQLRSTPGLAGLPWMVGPSRKRFIGEYTQVSNPNQRVMGTAGVVSILIQQGVDIVRVHDVKAIAETARMVDAIYR